MLLSVHPTQLKLSEIQSKVLTGQGMVLASGVKPVRATYKLSFDEAAGCGIGHGLLRANHAALKRMWLQPRVTLRLANGRRLDISITELMRASALFETTGEA